MEDENVSEISARSKTQSKKSESERDNISNKSDSNILSQLELMANRKKITKQKSSGQKTESIKSIQKSQSSKSSSKSSSDKSDSRMEKRRIKEIEKENKIETIRKEKSELLYKFNKLNATFKGKLSSLKLDMNNSLLEIKNEFDRIKTDIENEKSVSFYKRMLLLGVQGVEMMNTKFDPLGVDLDGWGEAMGYSLENQEYDEVLLELYEKYKSSSKISPELKLIGMIVMSATMFTATKKLSKLDTNFTNIFSNMFAQNNQNVNIPTPNDLNSRNNYNPSETSDDKIPSKLKGPDQDNLENILKTMRNNEKTEQLPSEELFKSISIKKKGRPKKTK